LLASLATLLLKLRLAIARFQCDAFRFFQNLLLRFGIRLLLEFRFQLGFAFLLGSLGFGLRASLLGFELGLMTLLFFQSLLLGLLGQFARLALGFFHLTLLLSELDLQCTLSRFRLSLTTTLFLGSTRCGLGFSQRLTTNAFGLLDAPTIRSLLLGSQQQGDLTHSLGLASSVLFANALALGLIALAIGLKVNHNPKKYSSN
jgi:hypothetical protein